MVVFAAGLAGSFLEGGAAEFGGPDDEGIVEHAALFEVFEEAGDGFVDIEGEGAMGVHVAMGVPVAVGA